MPRGERETVVRKNQEQLPLAELEKTCALPSALEYPALPSDGGEAEGLTPCKELHKCSHSLERNVNSQWAA